jgi:hypothetical protein
MKLFIPSFSFHSSLFFLFIYFFASRRACVVVVVYEHTTTTTTTTTPAYPSLQHFRSQNKVTREAVHYHSDCNHVTTDLRPLFFPSQLPPFNLSQRAPVLFWIFFVGFYKNLFAFTIF